MHVNVHRTPRTVSAKRRAAKIESLGGCPCAALRRASRRVTQAFDEELRPTGLRSTQFSLLHEISQTHAISRAELAQAAGLDRTTLTRSLALLERDGLIAEGDAGDPRERRVRVTPVGERLLERGLPLWARARARVAKRLGAARLRALLEELAEVDLPELEN
jgi:DNA-binding MarR family transcriptional regulator